MLNSPRLLRRGWLCVALSSLSALVACTDSDNPSGPNSTGGDSGVGGSTGGSTMTSGGTAGGAQAGSSTSNGGASTGGASAGGANAGRGGISSAGSAGSGTPTDGPCASVPASADALITNGSFDDGVTGWQTFGGGMLSLSPDLACSGGAGAVKGRTQIYQGPAQSLLGKVESGDIIGISAWVRIAGAATAPLNISFKTVANGVAAYGQVGSGVATSDGWTLLTGSAQIQWTGELTELTVYFEGPPIGVDIHVDNVFGIKRGAVGGKGTGNADGSVTVTLAPSERHQTLEGFGAAVAWYQERLTAHSKKAALYPILFEELGLDILRFRNRYQRTDESSSLAPEVEILAAAESSLGRAPKLLLSSWSPPAAIKANQDDDCTAAQATAKTCTLRKVNGQFDYEGFADYWATSLAEYEKQGIAPTWISIQNEPDFPPSGWEGCVFSPAESADYPGYNRALEMVHARLAALSPAPLLLGPETLGIHYNRVPSFLAPLNRSLLAGVAHHIYESGSDGVWDWKTPGPDSFVPHMFGVRVAAGALPSFQTEFNTDEDGGNTGGFETAWLMHNTLVEQGGSAFIYWELVWPPSNGANKGLVTLVDADNYVIRDQYYAMKHFSHFTDPGYVRIGAGSNLPGVRASAYQAPAEGRVVVVLLNVSAEEKRVQLDPGGFASTTSSVVRSIYEGGARALWSELGPLEANSVTLPPRSMATVVLTP
ncbi:MAG TPA: carbohydrate binding domain-containing protein [Polyangiaceae bacterium]|nr:carbohydrate binding domain-containing protein [Polyangiaceae bacterium]